MLTISYYVVIEILNFLLQVFIKIISVHISKLKYIILNIIYIIYI